MKKLLFLIPFAMLFVGSCSRDGAPYKEYVLTDDDKGFGVDHGTMEAVMGDVERLADMAMYNNNANFNGCQPTISHDTLLKILVIDFGAECKDANLVNRTGKIIVTYDLPYWDSGSVHRITFDNYRYQGDRLSGYKVIENRGYNSAGKRWFSVIMADTLYPGGGESFISFYAERSRVWATGFNTQGNANDDVYEVTGSGSMKRANNQFCDFNILGSLLISNDCKYVRSGVLQIIPKDGYSRTLDYGDGSCDDDATLDINGMVFNVKL